jgi:uncharacterized protein (DUF2141 family)
MRKILVPAAIVLALVTGGAGAARSQSAGEIKVEVQGLRNDDGTVRCGLYNSADSFRKPGQQFRGALAKITDRSAACIFPEVPAGTYAVALFHAEKNEEKIEYGFFGQPKQGYGFSENPDTTWGAPDFSDAAFQFTGGNLTLPVKVKY